MSQQLPKGPFEGRGAVRFVDASAEGTPALPGPDPTLTYEPYYGLKEKPFSLSADPKFLYKSPTHGPTFDDLLTGIRRREGLIVLTGEIGTGKTTLIRSVLQNLDRRTFTAFVPDPFVSREDLLKMLLVDFGVVSIADLKRGSLIGTSRADLSYSLYEFLDSLVPLQAFAVLIIDEAQNLPIPLLEEIRILSDLERRERLLQVVLVGQPELRAHMKLPEMRQLDQRVSVRCELSPLPFEDVARYVRHRLDVAGGGSPDVQFSDPAIAALFQVTKGVPRVINKVCDRALQHGYAARAHLIEAHLVATAAEGLGLAAARADGFEASPAVVPADVTSAGEPTTMPGPATGDEPPRASTVPGPGPDDGGSADRTASPTTVEGSAPAAPSVSPPVPPAAPDDTFAMAPAEYTAGGPDAAATTGHTPADTRIRQPWSRRSIVATPESAPVSEPQRTLLLSPAAAPARTRLDADRVGTGDTIAATRSSVPLQEPPQMFTAVADGTELAAFVEETELAARRARRPWLVSAAVAAGLLLAAAAGSAFWYPRYQAGLVADTRTAAPAAPAWRGPVTMPAPRLPSPEEIAAAAAARPAPSPAAQPPATTAPRGGSLSIIPASMLLVKGIGIQVASFDTPARGEQSVEELSAAGFRARVAVSDFGTQGPFAQVVIDGYTTVQDAERDAERVRALPGYADARVVSN